MNLAFGADYLLKLGESEKGEGALYSASYRIYICPYKR